MFRLLKLGIVVYVLFWLFNQKPAAVQQTVSSVAQSQAVKANVDYMRWWFKEFFEINLKNIDDKLEKERVEIIKGKRVHNLLPRPGSHRDYEKEYQARKTEADFHVGMMHFIMDPVGILRWVNDAPTPPTERH